MGNHNGQVINYEEMERWTGNYFQIFLAHPILFIRLWRHGMLKRYTDEDIAALEVMASGGHIRPADPAIDKDAFKKELHKIMEEE